MADKTHIEWTDATWNPITGCSVCSPGCTNCYAMKLAGTRLAPHPSRAGLTVDTKAGPVWTGEVRFNEQWLDQPLRWRRPRRIFVCAHGDLFHESVPDAWIDRVFAVMALAPQHTFQVLTKRAERMREYVLSRNEVRPDCPITNAAFWSVAKPRGYKSNGGLCARPLPNVWLGVSVEDQARADERRENFRATPAAVKFVSYEPALGPVDWSGWEFVNQIIGGGESGPKARPCHPDWQRATRDFCLPLGIAYFFKQWGEWFPYGCVDASGFQNSATRGEKRGLWHEWGEGEGFSARLGKKAAGRLLDGVEHNGFPEGRP